VAAPDAALRAGPPPAPRSAASGYSEGSSHSGSSYYSDATESRAPPPPLLPAPKEAKKPLLSWFRRSKAKQDEADAQPQSQDISAPGAARRTPQRAVTALALAARLRCFAGRAPGAFWSHAAASPRSSLRAAGGGNAAQLADGGDGALYAPSSRQSLSRLLTHRPPRPQPEERAAVAAEAQAKAEAEAAVAREALDKEAAVAAMRARGRPDDGHLDHKTRAEREEKAAADAKVAEEVAAAAAAAAPPPPPPKATAVLADFLAAAEVVAETNARFTSGCEASRALLAALEGVGAPSEGFAEVITAREALQAALSTRRSSSVPFSGADADVVPPLLPLLAAAVARCEAALDRSAVRVVRGAEARALWRHALGSAPEAPWPAFAAGLAGFLRASTEPRARFVLERVSSPSGDARLRWHVDRGNADAVSTAAVDAAFPPDTPLLERLEALLDVAPNNGVAIAKAHTTLPPRAPAGSLAPREAKAGELGERLLTERGLCGLALVGGAGMGKTALAVDEAHSLLQAGRLPGGAYFADLRGRESRPACGAALQLALSAPPLGGSDPEGAALAALRQAGARGTALLLLDGADAALADGNGAEFYALLSRILSCGEHVRLLITSRAAVESGLAGLRPHRVGALPLKSCIDALVAPFGPHAELQDPAQSRHFAKEACQLTGRAPLALALNVATLAATPAEGRGAAVGQLLHALRVARGVRFEGADTGSACVNCALTNPWDHVIEFLAPSAYYDTAGAARIAAEEEAALATAAAAAASPQNADFERAGDATIAGLKVPEYEAALKACALTAWAALPPDAKAAAPALAVFPASFDAHAAMAVLAEAPGVPHNGTATAIELLVERRLLSFDARAGRYSMALLVRKAMADTPLGAAALHAVGPVFVRYYVAQTADAEADAAAGQAAPGLYESDREWHNLFETISPWGLAGGADAELAGAIEQLREAHGRVMAARTAPSDRRMDVSAGDQATQVASLTAYAEQLAAKGSYDESLKAYQEALDLQVESAGGYDASLAATHSAMAFIRSQACDDESAVRDLQRALAIQTLALGPKDPALATTLVDMANAQRKTGLLDEAAASSRRAMILLVDAYGEEHPDVAVAYNELGNVYKAQGKMAEALDTYRLSLRIREASLGPKALDVANTLWNIACCYELQERFKDANQVLVRAVRIYQTELGPDHDETLEAMKFAARMGEATRVTTGGDEPWKANHKSHAWGRAAGQ
jgi:hypothetical protein